MYELLENVLQVLTFLIILLDLFSSLTLSILLVPS